MGLSLRILSGALLVAATGLGCSVAPQAEPQQSSQSKLLAPNALFKAKASAATTKATGVTEWRVYRGKTDFVLTGYDSKGKSVGGTAFRFAKEGKKNVLKARVLNGSKFSSAYTFGASASSTSSADKKTVNLFHRALADMVGIRLALQSQGRGYQGNPNVAGTTGLPATNPLDLLGQFGGLGQSCRGDLVSMLLGALQCVGGTGGLGQLNQANGAQLLQCALASQGAATSQATCMDPGADPLGGLGMGTPFDPTQMQDPNNPYGSLDPYGMGQGMDPYGTGTGGTDPYGTGTGGMDPYGAGGMGQLDPYGQGQYDPLGQGDPFGQGSCMSCSGGYDDFGVDPNTGGVGYGDSFGQPDPGGMTGGDPGVQDI